jgi:glycosyltransferase involved in cell wall biosynthesis
MTTIPRSTFLHLSPFAAIGGCEFDCLRVIDGLRDHDHRVLVFHGRGPMSSEWEALGAKVDHLSAWMTKRQSFRRALAAWAEAQPQPDGIFYWSTSRLPAIIQVLGHWPVKWAVHLGNPASPGFIPRVRRWVDEQLNPAPRNITLVACSIHAAASHLEASYFRRFPTEVVYNPVTPVFDQTHDYRELPIGSGPRIGMVARLDSIKDHLTVIRALAMIAHIRPSLTVEFAGDGEMRKTLENEARTLGMTNRVRFLGFVNVSPLLKEWDIYVHSTTASEGMGTSVAEAMMSGLPCIVSDLAVMREVCGDDGALYFPACDASALARMIVRLIENRADREMLGLAGQIRARRMFSLPEVAQAYLRVVSPINK